MAENNIDDIRQRYLRRPPVNSRRLENTSLDLEVPLEHLETEVLPLEAHETLGVGYGFDRLYALDLSQEQPVPIPLPSRHELTKYTRSLNPVELTYQGVRGFLGGPGGTGMNMNGSDPFTDFAGAISTGGSHSMAQATSNTAFEDLAKAFIGHGESSYTKTVGGSLVTTGVQFGPRIAVTGWGNAGNERNQLTLDPTMLQNWVSDAGVYDESAVRTLQYLYNYITPSAWEMTLTNRKLFTELPKNLAYLDRAFYSLYQRDKIGAFKTRIRDLNLLYLTLGMTEAMYTIRRGRFSKNIASGTSALNNSGVEVMQGRELTPAGNLVSTEINGGVMNPFFQLLEGAHQKLLVAPWWLINKLNNVLYLDTDRDEEVRDVERKDITEMMTLMLEAMEVERGLHFSSESNVPMTLFDKFKEAALPDFSDFTNSKAALSATLLGYDSPRDAYYDTPNKNIGRIGYYGNIATTSGQLIGKERLEFLDRLDEQEKHTILSPNPEKFKQGMQYANPFDYTTMVTRTRFGDHSMDMKIYPFGFYRGVHLNEASGCSFRVKSVTDYPDQLNLVFFPLYNWGQLADSCNVRGFLPSGINGAAFAVGNSSTQIMSFSDNTSNVGNNVKLWPENYWRPGADNYTARLLASTDEMFQSWIDRGEQVRADGATFPTIGPINLMAEMTYTTPMAMLQRNWPWLRKMATYPSSSATPASTDTSFDYMTLGDNMFNMSVHAGAGGLIQGPFALEDRDLFNPANPGPNVRSAGLDLVPLVLPLSKAPDNWVGVFQARDAMYFLTSLLSEPIMDSYTWNTASSGKSNGKGSARLVVYQGVKNFEGRVIDVFCTPMVGTGARWDASASAYVSDVDYSLPTTFSAVFPSGFLAAENSNYQMFLLDAGRISAGNVIMARGETPGAAADTVFKIPGLDNLGNTRTAPYMVAAPSPVLSENDFVPGLYWDKLWISNYPVDGAGNDVPYNQLFSHCYEKSATPLTVGMNYLNITSHSSYPGYPLGDVDHTVDDWRMAHVNWIELVRTNLEYQRAAPDFYIFDKDICDITESYLRQSLFPLGLSTVGPLTFIGAIGPEGQQVAAETVTGPTTFEITSLTLGAGTLDESPSDAQDADVGEENPSLHIAEKQDV